MFKTIQYRLTLCLIILLINSHGHTHEFWISPSTFSAEPGTIIDLELFVGQQFRGTNMPFIPSDIELFELVHETNTKTIKGLMGDSKPAAKITLYQGLNTVIYLTTPARIHFDHGDKRWAHYIEEDGLQRQLNLYPNLPQAVPISERYIRSVKSLITTEKTTDNLSERLPFELVVQSSLPLKAGEHAIQLLAEKKPVPDVMIKAFRYSDRSITDLGYTNQEGFVTLNLPTPNRYLISGVVIRPDDNPYYDWISYWPALTLEVSN